MRVVPTDFVIAQLETLAADVRLDAIKIGTLANADIVAAVADFLIRRCGNIDCVVLDPVMVATSGDRLIDVDGEALLRAPRVNTVNTHGTGCTLSSALAALRPQRDTWLKAALDAKSYLTAALIAADGLEIGHGPGGHGPVHHFHEIWSHR